MNDISANSIGDAVMKCAMLKEILDLEYVVRTNSTASSGHPRSSNSCRWSIEPNTFWKSTYVMYISLCVNLTSSMWL